MSSVKPESPFVSVSLDLFSGRPNPSWMVPLDQVEKWLATLPLMPGGDLPTEGLGYRGLTFNWHGQIARVYQGVVILPHAKHKDEARRFEKWLLDATRKSLAPDVLQAIGDDLP